MSRLRLALVPLAATVAILPSAATAHTGPILRGFGTAVIDAVPSPGEWDSAGRYDFNASRAPAEGGGTVPATLYVMNDQTNVYAALRVANASVGYSTFQIEFDNDHDRSGVGGHEIGDEALALTFGGFRDLFFRQSQPGFTWSGDEDYGGSRDGDGLDADHAGFSFYELSHPLDTSDNSHDFSLRPGIKVGLEVYFLHCPVYAQCVSTTAARSGDLIVVSGSRVPPDTQITAGPAEGSVVANNNPVFEFAGSDDVLAPPDLVFECKLDDDAWTSCGSPESVWVDDGRHTFSIRATDEMLNVDSTPAQRSWAVDTYGPSKPVIRGPRSARKGTLVLRFSARDEFTPPSRIRFKCAVDSKRLHRCPAVYRVKLRPGRHIVRVRAVDRLGNEGDTATFRIRVKRARR